jgi:prepilin-type processing-associated H-X9-DG protein
MAETDRPKPSLISQFLTTLVLSVLLVWLPALGPFIAAYITAKRVKSLIKALPAAIAAAAVWVIGLWLLSRTELKIGGQHATIGPLSWLGWASGGSILAGCLAGSAMSGGRGRGLVLAGAALLIACASGDVMVARDVLAIIKQVLPSEPAYKPELNKTCPDNLKQLYTAMMIYADSWDGTLPPADGWLDKIKDNVSQNEWLHCPEVSPERTGTKYGYAYNEEVAGKRISELQDAGKTPLIYDSTNLEPGAHDAAASLPKPGRHAGRNNVVFVDGNVSAEAPK